MCISIVKQDTVIDPLIPRVPRLCYRVVAIVLLLDIFLISGVVFRGTVVFLTLSDRGLLILSSRI